METLIPNDRELPNLAEFAGEEVPAVVLRVAGELCGRSFGPAAVTREHVRYRPGRTCVVAWSFADKSIVTGILFRGQRGARSLGRSDFQDALRPFGRDAERFYRYLPERELLLVRFPVDPRLSGLVPACDSQWVGKVFAPRVGFERSPAAEPVSYKPARRCVLRYAEGERSVYAKVYRDERGAFLAPRFEQLARTLAGGELRTPGPLAYFAEERVLAFEGLTGVREVKDELRDARTDAQAAERLQAQLAKAAVGLAALQRARIDGLAVKRPGDMLTWLAERAEIARRSAPELADIVRARSARLESLAARLEPEELVTSHGALRHDQLVARGELVYALDFDTLCRAGATADAGNLLGNLDVLALRRPRLAEVVQSAQAAFLAALPPEMAASDWLAWHRAAAQVKKLLRAFFCLDRRWRTMLASSGTCFDRTLAEVERTRCSTG